MPFARRKPDRNPLQRLSDQRRSLALAGLAAGAVASAAVFRRRRGGGETESEAPIPPPVPTAPPAGAGPPPAVEAPAAAAPEPPAAAPVEPAGGTVEPATGELSAEEASILAVLAQDGRSDDDRTAIAVATSLERDAGEVTAALRKLGAEGVVAGDLYTAAGDKIWAVTERGVRRLGAQS